MTKLVNDGILSPKVRHNAPPVLVRGSVGKRWRIECTNCGKEFLSYRKSTCCSKKCHGYFVHSKPYQKLCRVCETPFQSQSAKAVFCSAKCLQKDRYAAAKEERAAYRRTHRAKWVDYKRAYAMRICEIWRNGEPAHRMSHQSSEVVEAELLALRILQERGFSDILHTRSLSNYFPCDALAKKDGDLYLVEVTTSPRKELLDHRWALAQYLGAKLIVIHVKPDRTWHWVSYPNQNARASSCMVAFRLYLINKENQP